MVRQKLRHGIPQDAGRAGVIVDAEAPLAGARFIRGIAKRTLSAAGAAPKRGKPGFSRLLSTDSSLRDAGLRPPSLVTERDCPGSP